MGLEELQTFTSMKKTPKEINYLMHPWIIWDMKWSDSDIFVHCGCLFVFPIRENIGSPPSDND